MGKPAFGLSHISTASVLEREAFFEFRDGGPERRVAPHAVVIVIDVIERFASCFLDLVEYSHLGFGLEP